jgi:ankyrin repeat protein
LYVTENDFKQVLRICRPFIRGNPELLHVAVDRNHSDLIPKFISIAKIDLLQEKNQFGETVLLHAARLNRVDIIKVLLEKQNSDKLLEDTNNKGQNIFHILASNSDSDEILELFINYLLKNSINIQEKFDNLDEESHTPLQLAISKNNLVATRHFFKYFKKNVLKTSDHSGDNLIHLAVRYGDLSMLKYLMSEGQLIAQGTQSNLTKTPIELAQSLKHNDMVEYFKNVYPEPEDDESSEND